jgi:hypothetical protein
MMFHGLGGYDAVNECIARVVRKMANQEALGAHAGSDHLAALEPNLLAFTSSVMEVYLLLALDCGDSLQPASAGLNLFAIEGLKAFILGGHPATCQLGVDIVKALFLFDSTNVLVLEEQGIMLAVCSLLSIIAFRSGRAGPVPSTLTFLSTETPDLVMGNYLVRLRAALANMHFQEDVLVDEGDDSSPCNPRRSADGSEEADEEQEPEKVDSVRSSSSRGPGGGTRHLRPSEGAESGKIGWGCLVRDLLFLVQYAAVTLSERSADSTMLTFLVALIYSVTACRMGVACTGRGELLARGTSASTGNRHAKSPADRRQASRPLLCLNCESESATIQCMHAR